MGVDPLLSYLSVGVPSLARRPVWMVVQLVRQVRDTAEYMTRHVQDAAQLVWRALDGTRQQTTRVRTRSEVEWIVGPLTFSVSSGVLFTRPDDAVR